MVNKMWEHAWEDQQYLQDLEQELIDEVSWDEEYEELLSRIEEQKTQDLKKAWEILHTLNSELKMVQANSQFEYSPEFAKKYLDELNEKYPIRQVLWKYFEDIVSWEYRDFFNVMTWFPQVDESLEKLIYESAKAWKWIWDLTKYWDMNYLKNSDLDEATQIILKYELLWFSHIAPEMKRMNTEWEQSTWWKKIFVFLKHFINPKKLETMTSLFPIEDLPASSISTFEWDDETPILMFPKERLIQELMRRLWTHSDVWNLKDVN